MKVGGLSSMKGRVIVKGRLAVLPFGCDVGAVWVRIVR
jgi:hypothetical protein